MTVLSALGPEGYGSYEVTWQEGQPKFRRVYEPSTHMLVPGFVDLHIHGAWGIDFMSATVSEMQTLCDGLAREGYEAFLPTTVTASADRVLEAVKNLPDSPMVAGFHLEGPFISPERPGAQPISAIEIPPQKKSVWDEVLDHPLLRVVTLAPEQPHALELTTRLISRGVQVNMGHSNATFEEARRGYEFGAHGVTHLFNAMRPFHHREAGLVGYALVNDGLYTELIYDRKHVSFEAAQVLFKCKPSDRVVAISDGTRAIGLPAGTKVDLWGQQGIVGKGEIRTESGALAGSAITLLNAFANLAADFGPEIAIKCCCLNPRAILGLKGLSNTWVILDQDYRVVEITRSV